MPFPSYVHSVVESSDDAAWPVQGQGENECGCTAAANALNLLVQAPRFNKNDFVREAGLLFQRKLGGTPSPVTGWLIQHNGFGTHFGNLSRTNHEGVLRSLIDRGVPSVIELGVVRVGPFAIYGQHSVVLVGYSDPFRDRSGQLVEEYYIVDSQWPPQKLESISLRDNDRDVEGGSGAEIFPGNRTMSRQEFLDHYIMKIYFPVFLTQADHDQWYRANIRSAGGVPLLSSLTGAVLTGSFDAWAGAPPPAAAPQPS